MSDSDESGVTYTEVSSLFKDISDIGSLRADAHEYLELSGMPEDPYIEAALQAPPSRDYVPGPEEPKQAPPSPDYVPGPKHTNDEIITEDQPDPEEDDDEDPEEDPIDYPADGGDDEDDEDDEEGSSKDDEDDDMDIEADDEVEEEHLAPADFVVVSLPATNQAPSAEETEHFETDESAATPPPYPAYRVASRISILAPVPTPLWSDAEIPSLSLPLSPPSPVLSPAPPPSLIHSLGYQAAMIRMRAEAISTSHSLPLPPPFILSPTRPDALSLGIPPPLPILVPTSSLPLLLPSASHGEDIPAVTLPPRKRLDFELAQRLQAEEQGEITIKERSRLFVELMNRRKKHFAKLRAEEIRRKPPTKGQKRNQMSTYLKNMARYKHSQLKRKSYNEIQKLFDKEMKRVNTFVDMNLEVVKGSKTRTEESSKRVGDELESDISRR
ncbi:hypothetical protein Tco_0872097 [Tanacetum coccineum]